MAPGVSVVPFKENKARKGFFGEGFLRACRCRRGVSHKAASMVIVSKVTSQAVKQWGSVFPKMMAMKGKAEIV